MAIDTRQKNKDTRNESQEWDAMALWRKYAPKRLRELLHLDNSTVSIEGTEFFSAGLVDKTFVGPTVDFAAKKPKLNPLSGKPYAVDVEPPPGPGHDAWASLQPHGGKPASAPSGKPNMHPPIPKGGHNLHFDTTQLRGPDGKWLNEGKSDEEKAVLASKEEKAWNFPSAMDLQAKINNVEEWLKEHKDDHAAGTYYGGGKETSQKGLEQAAAYLEQLHKQAFEQNQQDTQAGQQEQAAQEPTPEQQAASAVQGQMEKQQVTQKATQQQSAELDKATDAIVQQVQQQNNVATGATVTGQSGTTGTVTIAGTIPGAKGKGTYAEPYDFSSMDGVISTGDQGLIDTSAATVQGLMAWYVNQAGGDQEKAYAHAQADLDHVGGKLASYPTENQNAAASKYYDLLMDIASGLYDATYGPENAPMPPQPPKTPTPAPVANQGAFDNTDLVQVLAKGKSQMIYQADGDQFLQTIGPNGTGNNLELSFYGGNASYDVQTKAGGTYQATAKNIADALNEGWKALPDATKTAGELDLMKTWLAQWQFWHDEGIKPGMGILNKQHGVLTQASQDNPIAHEQPTGLVNKTPSTTPDQQIASLKAQLVQLLDHPGLHTPTEVVAQANALKQQIKDLGGNPYDVGAPATPASVIGTLAHYDHKWIDTLLASKGWQPEDPDNAYTKKTVASMIGALKPSEIQEAIDKTTDTTNYVAGQLGSSLVSSGDSAKHTKMVGMLQLQAYYLQELKKVQAGQGTAAPTSTPPEPGIAVPPGYKFKKVTLLKDTKGQIDTYIKNWHGTPAAHYNDVAWVNNWSQGIMDNHNKASVPPDKYYDGSYAYETGLVHAQLAYLDKQIQSGKLTPEEANAASKMRELFQHAQDYYLAKETGQEVPQPAPGYDLEQDQFNQLDYTKKIDWLNKHGIIGNEGNWDLYSEGGQEAAYLAGMKGKVVPPISAATASTLAPYKPTEPPTPTGDKWQDAENQALWEYQQFSFGGSAPKTSTTADWDKAYAKWQDARKANKYAKMDPQEVANAADDLQARIDDTDNTGWTDEQKDGFRKELEQIKQVTGLSTQKEPQAADYPDYKSYYKAHKDWAALHTTAAKKATQQPEPLPKKKAGSQLLLPGLEDPYLNERGEVMDPGRFNPNGSAFRNYGGPNEQELYDAFADLNTLATSSERNAMDNYMDGGYDVNQKLRQDVHGASNDHMVKGLDSLFAKPDVVAPRHMLVYRSGSMQDPNGDNIWEPGEITWDDGFVSTSNNLSTAQGFSGTLFAIEIPKGQKAAWAQKTVGTGIGGESEILLPRGSRFVRTGELRIPLVHKKDSYGYDDTKYDYDHAEPIAYGALALSKSKTGDPGADYLVMPRLRYLGPNYHPGQPLVLDIPGQRPPFGVPGYSGPAPDQQDEPPKTLKEQQKLPGLFSVSRVLTNGDTGEPLEPNAGWSQEDQDERNRKAFTWGPGDVHKTGEYLDEYRKDDDEDPDGDDNDPSGSPQEPPGSPQSDFGAGAGMFGPVTKQHSSQGIVGAAGKWWQRLVNFAFNPGETRDWHGRWIGEGIATAGGPGNAQANKQTSTDAATIMGNKVGGSAGSNDGGFWHGTDNKDRYVKAYDDPTQAYGEVIANALYDALGQRAPRSAAFQKGNSVLFASELAPGTTPDNSRAMQLGTVGLTKERANQVLDGWLADVLTANWDVLGLDNDNILDTGDGHGLWRIDNGSAFLHRAQGARKPTGGLHDVGEWDSLGPYGQNQNYRKVWNAAGLDGPNDPRYEASLHAQLAQLKALRADLGTAGFKGFVHGVAPGLKGPDADTIAQMLEDRTQRLVDKIEGRGAIFSSTVPYVAFMFDPTQLRGTHGMWTDEGKGRAKGAGTPTTAGTQGQSEPDWPAPDPATQKRIEFWAKANIAKYGEQYRNTWEGESEHWHAYMAHDAVNELHLADNGPAPYMWAWDKIRDIAHESGYPGGANTPHTEANAPAIPAPAKPTVKRNTANLGVTPYRGKPVAEVEGTSGYYQSTRYRGWLSDVRSEAKRLHVNVEDVVKATGIWKGNMEPSASVWLSGDPAQMKALACSLGGEYNQEGVMLFSGDNDNGTSALYSIPGLDEKERDQAIKQMQQYGLDGGRVVQERNGQYTLEVTDLDGTLYDGVLALSKAIKHELFGTPGSGQMLMGGSDYTRRTRQHKGAGVTYASEEGVPSAT